MTAPGYNPMRWDCEQQGCFNRVKRPKIELFAECFPGNINFGDIDGVVELNNRFLQLEWKESTGNIPKGQRILYERLTRSMICGDCAKVAATRFHVFVIAGDAETMTVRAMQIWHNGKCGEWSICGLDHLKQRITDWARWAKTA